MGGLAYNWGLGHDTNLVPPLVIWQSEITIATLLFSVACFGGYITIGSLLANVAVSKIGLDGKLSILAPETVRKNFIPQKKRCRPRSHCGSRDFSIVNGGGDDFAKCRTESQNPVLFCLFVLPPGEINYTLLLTRYYKILGGYLIMSRSTITHSSIHPRSLCPILSTACWHNRKFASSQLLLNRWLNCNVTRTPTGVGLVLKKRSGKTPGTQLCKTKFVLNFCSFCAFKTVMCTKIN